VRSGKNCAVSATKDAAAQDGERGDRVLSLERLGPGPVRRLLAVTDPWLSCDECFDDLDVVIDAVVGTGAGMSDRFRVHLHACDACDEEAGCLAALAAQGLGVTPWTARERFVAAKQGVSRLPLQTR
jgi:hypothetical protein